MRTQLTFQLYTISVSVFLTALNNFTKYDIFWLVFMLAGIFIMLGHSIFIEKVKHSFGKICWMVTASFTFCLLIKFLHGEGSISTMSMIISTIITSMIAPPTLILVLKEMPEKLKEQFLKLPGLFFGALKRIVDRYGSN